MDRTKEQNRKTAKIILCGLYGIYVAHALDACGIQAGPIVAGTTGFLEEANRGKAQTLYRQMPLEHHTEADRAALAKTIAEAE